MSWFAVYAVTFVIMTSSGMQHKHEQGFLAHGKPFMSAEDCRHWFDKTDFHDYFESELDALPKHTVLRLGTGCYQPGRNI